MLCSTSILITHADDSHRSKAFNVSVWFVHSITQKRMIPKSSNLVQGMTLGYPTSGMVLGLKGERSRSQGNKVKKHIEGNQVAGVSFALY